jgi:hypothetical protein
MTHERQEAVRVLFTQFDDDELRTLFLSLATVKPDQFTDEKLRGLALVMSEIARLGLKDRGLL